MMCSVGMLSAEIILLNCLIVPHADENAYGACISAYMCTYMSVHVWMCGTLKGPGLGV